MSTRELLACGLTPRDLTPRPTRSSPPTPHRGLGGWPRQPSVGGANAGGGQGVRPRRGAQPLLRRRALGISRPGRADRGGHGRRTAAGASSPKSSAIARRSLEARDRTRLEGIPITTPARTLIDVAAVLTDAELRHAVRRAQGLRRVNVRQLLEVIGRLGPRRGSPQAEEAIATGRRRRAAHSRTPYWTCCCAPASNIRT